jgi:23S rRNA (uracil1939-C5)-methyltransferase
VEVQVEPGAAGEQAHLVAAATGIIVDPPRRGLDAPLLRALCAGEPCAGESCTGKLPGRLIYLSCGADSFLQDAEALLHAGWRLSSLEVYGLFPFTQHVETLACFERG